jgi:hypothetical protein
MNSSGKNLMIGLASGINAGTPWVESAARKAAKAAKRAVDEEMDNGSPSREMIKRGKWSMMGLGIGIERNANIPIRAARQAAAGTLMDMRASGGNRQIPNQAKTKTIIFEGPIVDKMIVPNTAVGRQQAKAMAEELSSLTNRRRG